MKQDLSQKLDIQVFLFGEKWLAKTKAGEKNDS